MRIASLLKFVTILLLVLASAGCALKTTYIPTATSVDALSQYPLIEVAPVKYQGRDYEINSSTLAAVRGQFMEYFTRKKMLAPGAAAGAGAAKIMVLRSEIIGYDKGDQGARLAIGLGAGAATLVVHVALHDKASDQLLAETDVTDTSEGDPLGNSNAAIMAKRVAKAIDKFIQKRGLGGR